MSPVRSDPPRLRLNSTSYERLRQQVLRRDGWRCQSCGTMSNLEVHHRQFRSHSGHDSEENLITLCACCHEEMHIPRGTAGPKCPTGQAADTRDTLCSHARASGEIHSCRTRQP
jgi:5-methylcytosine-specific restriction endonuclease McrA